MTTLRHPLLQQSRAVTTPPPEISDVPGIRLVGTTPSATGLSSEPSAIHPLDSPWASRASPSALTPLPKEASPRKRLVPKKSKLSMLGVGGGIKEREKMRDFSDVVRRVGGNTESARGGFEIYVDPTEDPDIEEIILVRKKKSRAALDGMGWGGGSMTEVTNVPPVKAKAKEKEKEKEEGSKEKWWAMGRGRKDSKEKDKAKDKGKDSQRPNIIPRSKTPEPFKSPPQEARTRFNSLDSGALLSAPNTFSPTYQANNFSSPEIVPQPQPRSRTPTLGGLPAPPNDQNQNPRQGSIALRAMRSLARIGSWAQLKNPGNEVQAPKKHKDVPKKEKTEKKDTEKKKKKKKKKKKVTEPKLKPPSTSSFEAGALTTSPEVTETLGFNKKRSILGLGLPSAMTMKLPATRGRSTPSSTASQAPPPVVDNNRFSVESAVVMARPASAMSTASLPRPNSRTSRASSGSGTSVKWDEAGLETVREVRDRERGIKKGIKEEQKRRDSREGRRSSEGRKRTLLNDILPEIGMGGEGEEARQVGEGPPGSVNSKECPIVTVETATCDGHEDPGTNEVLVATPVRRARPRPASDQLLGKARPRGIYEDPEDGALSVLDAVTNDLAMLINTLDLEATPGGTSDPSPIARRNTRVSDTTPTKMKAKTLRPARPSITSLRPHAQATVRTSPPDVQSGQKREIGFVKERASELELGKQIAPWPVLDNLPPVKPPSSPPPPPRSLSTAFTCTHERTFTPGPAPDPSPVLRPLRPAKSRVLKAVAQSPTQSVKKAARPPPSTFRPSITGFRTSTSSKGFNELENHPIFMRKRALLGADNRASRASTEHEDTTSRRPLAPGARKMLGMKGTMGGSDVSAYAEDVDVSDPDSDIPDELQFILHGKKVSVIEAEEEEEIMDYWEIVESGKRSGADDAMDHHDEALSFINDRLGGLSFVDEEMEVDVPAPPVFHAQVVDEQEHHADLQSAEEDMNKSFDFTGELRKLNESGESDRHSFVEQLEKAFRTPAKIDLRYSLTGPIRDGFLQVDIPSIPSLPPPRVPGDSLQEWTELATALKDVQKPTLLRDSASHEELSKSRSSFDMYTTSQVRDMKQPTLLSATDSLTDEKSGRAGCGKFKSPSSSGSHPPDGEPNKFKFGGSSSSPPISEEREKPMTLSDIIPPPAHARSLSMGSYMKDDSVRKSILAEVSEVPRAWVNSDSSSKRPTGGHSRNTSGSSFTGLDSFEEVRRGFEFPDDRPTFYPPSAAAYSKPNRYEPAMGFASVSSYGRVANPGVVDPSYYGDCGLPSLQERPSSESLLASMSMSVDDAFAFLPRRRRVDSDASSFYFKPSGRRNESNFSISSQFPPSSRYNRSFGIGFGGGHRLDDSMNGMSSVGNLHAIRGANAGRAAWARHNHRSQDSAASEFSPAMHLGRPGVGDKMFDTAPHEVLTSIFASPSESVKSSFDSTMDVGSPRSEAVDSLFDHTGIGSSETEESPFGHGYEYGRQRGHLAPPVFRPPSVPSMNARIAYRPREDDTMISMLGGGHHERRESIGSIMDIDKSPCIRVEKRKHSEFRMKGDVEEGGAVKARIVMKPSIASTAESTKFGEERMIRAQQGLLDRHSLEESCLIADGEDMSFSFGATVCTKPEPLSRSCSSTCTSNSGTSGSDTPPLSPADGSSMSEGSQSSIDLEEINAALTNATHPMSSVQHNRVRARARGHGHRQRFSHAPTSRSSVYETIQEEATPMSSPDKQKASSHAAIQPVFVVDEDTASIHSATATRDDERGIVALRRYYELRDEAESAVTESKRVWVDTPFSLFALQCFDPPTHPAGMQALLEHSVQNYGPLPSELRPKRVRSRTSSRASPYPSTRVLKAAAASPLITKQEDVYRNATSSPLGDIAPHANAPSASKPFSPSIDEPKQETMWGVAATRPRVGSAARRTAIGWAKRNGKTSTGLKENTPKTNMKRGDSLRLSRPRPKGRPTPARHVRL
ncbi:uncharacterized protein BT62DRAFT_938390 [Guyanagaster necrorhizus]|uniref:Uncharacterized protein n=1 Tax=Guyanagaster necrorhizus TaxID=856835 RepID=A0A9P7VGP9_9AGAR|nr:uncharacterized protein BT62DRAFT_938390 [Guyanagaster necrorhizus MCA 3950]KAG7440055.1 hypothetical protein BT62DRAFT_938390 [Guyanagaster necrorhizus MCA 3950]